MRNFLPVKTLLLLLSILFIWYSCKHEPVDIEGFEINDNTNPQDTVQSTSDTCSSDTVYFENDILPIIISNCAISGCHDAQSAQDGIVLDSYSNIISYGDVRAGSPGNSDLYEVITESDPSKLMPPSSSGRSLSAQQKETIRSWIEQGAKNNSCQNQTGNCDTTNVGFSSNIQVILQNNCLGCHSGTAPQGQVDLSTYTNVKVYADNGRLFGSVNHDSGYTQMPYDGTNDGTPKLDQCKILTIKAWINQGALNN